MAKDMMEVIAYDGFVDPLKFLVVDREVLCFEARLAATLIERWGMVAGEIDGEDSTGRSKIRRMTADELVGHATETAALATAKFRELDWVKVMPSYGEVQKAASEIAAKEDAPKDRDGNRKRFLGIF